MWVINVSKYLQGNCMNLTFTFSTKILRLMIIHNFINYIYFFIILDPVEISIYIIFVRN